MKKGRMDHPNVNFKWFIVAPGVWGMKDVFVNIYMIHNPTNNTWVLVDAGLKWTAPKIKHMAEELFWPEVRPAAIVLTHGHFDHVGSLLQLANEWQVPVYAHYLEEPYLTGQCSYPPPDPTVGGGMMATLSWMYPRGPIDISEHLEVLPEDGSIPVLPGWEYIHTPGHTPGHVSLFREWDRLLIAGDAFVTTKAESATSILFQKKVVSGPPKYFTTDWDAAAESVQKLTDLEPGIVATGHGLPMQGAEMKSALQELARNFEKLAVPTQGRYIDDPAVANEAGVTYTPPAGLYSQTNLTKLAGVAAVAIALYLIAKKSKKTRWMAALASGYVRSKVREFLPSRGKKTWPGVNGKKIFTRKKRKAVAAMF